MQCVRWPDFYFILFVQLLSSNHFFSCLFFIIGFLLTHLYHYFLLFESIPGRFLLEFVTTVLPDINSVYDPTLAARKSFPRDSDGFEPLEAYFNSEDRETSKS